MARHRHHRCSHGGEALRCIPKKYSQIMLAIEMLLDLEALSIKVTGRIKAMQDREEAPHTEPSTAGGKLLYTAE